MNGVSASSSSSIETVNRIFQAATSEALAAADKMMKYTVSEAVGKEMGKGERMDLTA